METVIGGDRLPTAVFAEYDEMAFGAMLTLRRAGLSVPGDISVVGFDDHEMASVVDLTTVSQPVHEQGEHDYGPEPVHHRRLADLGAL